MKKTLSVLVCLLASFLISNEAYCQIPGATFANPINVGTLTPGSPFTDQKNNSTVNGYGNEYGQSSDDIFYKFIVPYESDVIISLCGSSFDTFLYLLNSSGGFLAACDDDGPICPLSDRSSLKLTLAAGTYYVVCEGYGSYSGNLDLSIALSEANEVNSGFATEMANVFENLEVSRVPYYLLRDIALEQANLDNYQGTILADSNIVNFDEFFAIYQTIVSARVSSLAGTFTDPGLLDSLGMLARQPGRILLSGLHYKYSQFKSNAVSGNLIEIINGQVYDRYINGVWQNPYDIRNVIAFAPSVFEYEGMTQQFLLPSNLWLTNNSSDITSIEFNAGDGVGYRSISPGTPVSITYSTVGLKTLTFKITLASSGVIFSHARIQINALSTDLFPDREVIQVTATEAFESVYPTGTITIDYANPQLGLRNPIIIAEGFDPGKILKPESVEGEHNLQRFLDVVEDQPSELRNLLVTNQSYDLVYVDWGDGTANIKRNAKLLKEVIRIVNSRKALTGSIAKNVIIGQSMGGLVTRWALKEMENSQELHKTKLYISHDVPHQGANVPIGYQYLVRHLNDLALDMGFGSGLVTYHFLAGNLNALMPLKIFKTPAVRQMLVNWVSYGSSGSYIDNSIHNTWQNELRNMGYPQGDSGSPIRNIAVSNGSECALPQSSSPGSSLLSLDGKGNTRFLGDLTGMIGALHVSSMTFPQFSLGVLPGKNEIKFDVQVNAVDTDGGNRVYYNKITYTKRFLWLIPITTTLTNKSRYAPENTLTYESYPGGIYITGMNFNDSSNSDWFAKYSINASHNQEFGFVPVTSALDIGSGNTLLGDQEHTQRYIGSSPPSSPHQSPFTNFITAATAINSNNEDHLSISLRAGNWLGGELNGLNPVAEDCTLRCGGNVINGPSQICTTGNYSVSGIPNSTTILWTTTGNLVITGATNQTTVTVAKGTGTGNGTLTANLTTACATASPQISITVKTLAPVVYNWDNLIFEWYSEHSNIYVTNPQPGWTYLWEISGSTGANFLEPHYATQSSTNIVTQGAGYMTLNLTVTDGCGATGSIQKTFYIQSYERYSIYPNPVSSEVTIEFGPKKVLGKNTVAPNIERKVVMTRIYDDKNKLLKTQSTKLGETSMKVDVSNIPDGSYFLHIQQGKSIEKSQLIIKH